MVLPVAYERHTGRIRDDNGMLGLLIPYTESKQPMAACFRLLYITLRTLPHFLSLHRIGLVAAEDIDLTVYYYFAWR